MSVLHFHVRHFQRPRNEEKKEQQTDKREAKSMKGVSHTSQSQWGSTMMATNHDDHKHVF